MIFAEFCHGSRLELQPDCDFLCLRRHIFYFTNGLLTGDQIAPRHGHSPHQQSILLLDHRTIQTYEITTQQGIEGSTRSLREFGGTPSLASTPVAPSRTGAEIANWHGIPHWSATCPTPGRNLAFAINGSIQELPFSADERRRVAHRRPCPLIHLSRRHSDVCLLSNRYCSHRCDGP